MQENKLNITAHFTIAEIENSTRAKELGIDNTMPSIYFGNAQNVARFILEPVRLHFGKPFSPSSWYRCKKLNDAVDGSVNSDHMIGAAVDFVVPGVSPLALAEYIRDNLIYDQLIYEVRPNRKWVHASYKRDNNRMQVSTNINGDSLKGLICSE